MITINMLHQVIVLHCEKDYTDYTYDGKFFIIIRNGEWVGFYNLDHVISIIVDDEKAAE